MANGLNQCNFIGNLGQDPEVRYTPSGKAVANLSLAVTFGETTEWVRVTAWEKLAEIIGTYLKKGSKIYIGGRMQTRSWDDKGGVKRYTTEIIANQMLMLSDGQKHQDGGDNTPPPMGESAVSFLAGNEPAER